MITETTILAHANGFKGFISQFKISEFVFASMDNSWYRNIRHHIYKSDISKVYIISAISDI